MGKAGERKEMKWKEDGDGTRDVAWKGKGYRKGGGRGRKVERYGEYGEGSEG